MACRNVPSRSFGSLSSPEGCHYGSLDESNGSFPSLFTSPFTKASLCAFLVAMPTQTQSPAPTFLSSSSTLAFLSMSFSLKTRSVSGCLREPNDMTPASSLLANIATALRSFHLNGRSSEQFQENSKGLFRSSSKQLRKGPLHRPVQASSMVIKAELLTNTAGQHPQAYHPLTGSQSNECSELDLREAVTTSIEHQKKSTAELKAEKRAAKIKSISKYLVSGAVSTIVARTFVAPLERLKLEYVVGRVKHNWMKVIQGIWIAEGPAGFWKGNMVNLLRMVPFKSINFLTYDMFCKELLERQGKVEVTNFDRLLAGAASGAAATMLCIPLDTVRTRLIAPGGDALGGIHGCFLQMIHKEGFLSLYKGLLPALLSMVPAGAVFYGVYDILKVAHLQSCQGQREILKQRNNKGHRCLPTDNAEPPELGPVRTLIYGAIAGACAETVTYPLEVVRRQLQLQQTAAKMGLMTAFQTIIERDGFGALFSGVVPSTVQVLPSAALSYLVYESMKSLLKVS